MNQIEAPIDRADEGVGAAGFKEKIFWHETVDMRGGGKLGPLPASVDVAVIGGGFTGLSAARTLAKRGVRVAVLEAETVGWGASSRNGGMVLTGLKLPMQTAFRRYGQSIGRSLFQCSLTSIDTVEQIVREEGIDCGFFRTGHLQVANKPKHYPALERLAEFMDRELGHHLRLVPRKDLNTEIGSEHYYGALVDATSGGLNPAQYVTGLAGAAMRSGASIFPHARVVHLRREPRGFQLHTERGSVIAQQVLVATSGYTGRAIPALSRKIIPIGSFIIATVPLPESLLRTLIPHGRMIFDNKHYLSYFRLWDRRLLFGGRAAFFPENHETIRRSARILQRAMIEVFPQLKDTPIEYAWGGTLDFAFDMMPHIGELDGLFYSLGYAGHGVAMSTYLGQAVAGAMLDGNIREHPFAQMSFPGAPLGLYNGRPWFLPFAIGWQKILDWIE